MKYKYNKENLIRTLNNLSEFVDKNWTDKEDSEKIDHLLSKLEEELDYVQSGNDDCFGTEGYEVTIMGK